MADCVGMRQKVTPFSSAFPKWKFGFPRWRRYFQTGTSDLWTGGGSSKVKIATPELATAFLNWKSRFLHWRRDFQSEIAVSSLTTTFLK